MRHEDEQEPIGFARRLAETVARACAGTLGRQTQAMRPMRPMRPADGSPQAALRGAYLHGSAALGGWVAQRSDVDVLLVADEGIGEERVRAVGELLVEANAGCPGAGLEFSLVTVDQAARPRPPHAFLLHGGNELSGMRLAYGTEVSGDPDLIMHYVVCRAAGITLYGAPADELIGPVARGVVLRYLAGELDWGLEHGTESYAVLNACRGLEYLEGGHIVSKIAGGEAALRRGTGPGELIRQALDQQRAIVDARPPGPEAIDFVRGVSASLAGAATEDH